MTAQTPENRTALARIEPDDSALAMVMDPGEAVRRLQALQQFIAQVMVKDEDYGTIPHTPKPTLYQPGAQKLAEIYGLAVDFQDNRPPIERWDRVGDSWPFVAYFKKAIVTRRRDGLFLGTGIGQCNSWEKKYEKQEAASIANTIEKMACKRALIAGIISVTRSSGIFTQDLEDMSPGDGATAKGKAKASEAEWEDAPKVSPEVLDARKRWEDPDAAWTAETTAAVVKTLGASPDANDRAMVWEWRIAAAKDAAALDAIAGALASEPNDRLRADMLADVAKARKPANGGAQGAPA